MKLNHAIDSYPDLLDSDHDAALERLVVDLATLYRGAAAPTVLRTTLDAALRDAGGAEAPLNSRTPRHRRFRLGAGALGTAVALALVLGGVAYAVVPLVSRLLTTEQGATSLPMRTIGQSQTAHGVTVTLERGYADANRVLVAYTIQVPSGFANSTSGIDGKIGLADAQGLTLPLIDGQGLNGDTQHVSAGLVTFDAESLRSGIATVSLRLTFLNVRAAAKTLNGAALTAGPFTFSFSLPVAPGRVVSIARTSVVKGVPVTLERVVITPSETRAYLRFAATAGISADDWNAQAHISGTGWDSRTLQPPSDPADLVTTGTFFVNARGEHVTTWSGDFVGHHGEWTLTVDWIWGADTSTPIRQDQVSGPWTFRFSLP